jgi:hypothetical protein
VEQHWNRRKTTQPWRNGSCQDNLLPRLKTKSPICSDLLGLSWWERLLERIERKFKEEKEDTSRKINFFQKYDTNKQNMSWKIRKSNNPFVVHSVATSCTWTQLTDTTRTWHQCYCRLSPRANRSVTVRATKCIPSKSKLTSSVIVLRKEKLHALY